MSLHQAVPAIHRNGEIIGYRLNYSGAVVDVDVPSPTSAVVRDISCDASLLVTIFSRTKVGASAANATLLILPGWLHVAVHRVDPLVSTTTGSPGSF